MNNQARNELNFPRLNLILSPAAWFQAFKRTPSFIVAGILVSSKFQQFRYSVSEATGNARRGRVDFGQTIVAKEVNTHTTTERKREREREPRFNVDRLSTVYFLHWTGRKEGGRVFALTVACNQVIFKVY